MKKVLSFFILLTLSLSVYAEMVSEAEALVIAHNFMNEPIANTAGHRVARAPRRFAQLRQQVVSNQQFYIFNSTDGNGYVIVSSDDVARPILGWSDSGNLNINDLPENIEWWLNEYNDQIRWAQVNNIPQNLEVSEEWINQRRGVQAAPNVVVGPLLTTTWDQGTPYNNLCPVYTGSTKSAVGCGATAAAQIMNYHQWPATGTGYKSYTTTTRGFNLSANFGSTSYDWRNMKDSYSGSYSSTQANAVATLMYHVGIASNMNYASDNTGQSETSPAYIGYALTNFFGYSKELNYINKSAYQDASWIMIIKNQLDQMLPVLYTGGTAQTGGGHAFVCDGYRSDYYFHINWGWGSVGDGYYSIFALVPSGTGIGAGSSHNYTTSQAALVDIKPDTAQACYNLQMYSEMFSMGDTITQGDTITKPGYVMNVGKLPFTGNIYLTAVSTDGSEVFLLDSLVGVTLTPFNIFDAIIEEDEEAMASGVAAFFYQSGNTYDIPAGDYYLTYIYEDASTGELNMVGSDYYLNACALHVKEGHIVHPGKYLIYAMKNGDAWFLSSDLTTTSTKRFVTDTIANKNQYFYINTDATFVWDVARNSDGSYTIKCGDKYMSWNSGNSAAMSSTAKNMEITPLPDSYAYSINFKATATETRYLSFNTANNTQYFAFYANKNQEYQLYFVEAFDMDTITVRAKMPSNWGNTIRAWVWYDGEEGVWATPTLEDGWYVYRGLGEYNIIFVNGTTWNGDNNQTVDIPVLGDMCIQLNSNTSGKRTFGQIECDPEPFAPDCKTLPFTESFASNQGEFTIENVALDGLGYVWTFASGYGMKASAYVSSVNHPTESWLISPCLELSEDAAITLTFDHVYRYTSAPTTDLNLLVSEDYVSGAPSTATWAPVVIPTYSSGNNWTFVNAGNINLNAYAGKNVTLAFRYKSTSSAAATWEIKNVSVTSSTLTTGVDDVLNQNNATKCIIDGHLFILTPDGTFDATGRRVEE